MKILFQKYLFRKRILGAFFGFLLAIIVQNIDERLWVPFELEIINNRNRSPREINYRTNNSTDKIVLILFDDKTQFFLRQEGMPIKDFEKKGKKLIKEAIEKLESDKVKAVGLNLNLSSQSGDDEELAKTVSKYKNIVLVDSVPSLYYSKNSLIQNISATGFGELFTDYDKVVHKISTYDANQKQFPSFSYALYKFITNNDLKIKNEFFLRYPKKSFKSYSFVDLIQGNLDTINLKDKIIIIGTGLKSKLVRDQLHSPIKQDLLLSDSEVQAVSLLNLLDGTYLSKLGLDNFKFSFVFFSIFIGTLFSCFSAPRRLIFSCLIFLGLVFSAQISYTNFNLILELVPSILVLAGNLIVGSLVYLQINLQRQNWELAYSQKELREKNKRLSIALDEINRHVNEIKEVRKQLAGRSEEERKRIARDLHDDTLAQITDLRRTFELNIGSEQFSPSLKKLLENSIATLNNLTQEVRRTINALRPSMLDNVLGLIPAIENLLDELTRRSHGKIKTRLLSGLSRLKLSEQNEIHLYRIIQEALNNILKHSEADKAEIIIEQQPGQVLILVSDNGKGFLQNEGQKPKKGFGLLDMHERAELIGAHIQHLNKPGTSGAILEIIIPVEKVIEFKEKIKDSILSCGS